jgi:hypothetical protein
MNRRNSAIFSIFGVAVLGAAVGASPASAQTFQRYRCADGTQFIVGFYQYDSRAHLQIDGREVTLARRLAPLRLALFGRRRHAENHWGGDHRQARQAADDGMRTDMNA